MKRFSVLLCVCISFALIHSSNAYQTTPGLGTLATHDGDTSNYYTVPVMTCHSDFNVTIEAGNWSLIAVDGYELQSGNYGYKADRGNDSMCVSQSPYETLHFDIQDHCHGGMGTMKIFNNTYTFTVRARAEWMVETQQDRLYPMKCEYTLTGEARWESVTKVITQVFSTEAEIEATRNVIINGSTIHLVNANDADDGAAADTVWAHLDQAQVGQMVRILINTTNTGWHYEAPYVGVTGCWFYDQPPENPDAMQFNLVDQYGCNKPPSYYDPFTAADTPRVNGMLLNKQPVDSIDPSSAAADPTAQAGTPSAGYLSGPQEKGVAYSDKLKMFKFPGSGVVYSKCTLRFCVEWDDPRCITPLCQGKFYTGSTYGIGEYGTIYRRRRRRAADETDPTAADYTEDVVTVITVQSAGTTTKIVNGPGDLLTTEIQETKSTSLECETRFYAVLGVTICLSVALIVILVVYLFKKADQKIRPFEKAMFIEGAYGRPDTTGSSMYGGGMRMGLVGGNGGLPMISK